MLLHWQSGELILCWCKIRYRKISFTAVIRVRRVYNTDLLVYAPLLYTLFEHTGVLDVDCRLLPLGPLVELYCKDALNVLFNLAEL